MLCSMNLSSFFTVIHCVNMMSMCHMCMMSSFFSISCFMVLRRFTMDDVALPVRDAEQLCRDARMFLDALLCLSYYFLYF